MRDELLATKLCLRIWQQGIAMQSDRLIHSNCPSSIWKFVHGVRSRFSVVAFSAFHPFFRSTIGLEDFLQSGAALLPTLLFLLFVSFHIDAHFEGDLTSSWTYTYVGPIRQASSGKVVA